MTSAPTTADVRAGLLASVHADHVAWLAAALLKAARHD